MKEFNKKIDVVYLGYYTANKKAMTIMFNADGNIETSDQVTIHGDVSISDNCKVNTLEEIY